MLTINIDSRMGRLEVCSLNRRKFQWEKFFFLKFPLPLPSIQTTTPFGWVVHDPIRGYTTWPAGKIRAKTCHID